MEDYSSISLLYRPATEEVADVDETVPAYLSDYSAPAVLGTEVFSPVVSIDGSLYQLPCPVSAFLDNGWKLSNNEDPVAARDTSLVTLSKDGKELDLSIKNFSDYLTIPSNCAVYRIRIDVAFQVDYVLPSGIRYNMTEAELKEVLTDDFTLDEYSDFNDYVAYDSEKDFLFAVEVSRTTGQVTEIRITKEIWPY